MVHRRQGGALYDRRQGGALYDRGALTLPNFFAFAVRPTAGVVASALFLAATRLTWAGLAAVAVFCLLVFDAQRRVRRVLDEMDDVNSRLDVVVSDIEELKAFIASDDGEPDST